MTIGVSIGDPNASTHKSTRYSLPDGVKVGIGPGSICTTQNYTITTTSGRVKPGKAVGL